MKQRKQWVMPAWMEPYRPIIRNTGGNEIEDLMNRERALVQVNAPLAIIQAAVESQIALLDKLHANDALLIPQVEAVINSIGFVVGSKALPPKMRPGLYAIGQSLQKAIDKVRT